LPICRHWRARFDLTSSAFVFPLLWRSRRQIIAFAKCEDCGNGQIPFLESALSSDFLSALEGALQSRAVWVGIPKCKFGTASISLKNMLSALGMAAAFSDTADFSGIDGARDLLIQDAIHKAFVSVDERGTEAAAATAVIVRTSSLEFPPPVPFTADRPFIFLIKDNATGTVVFIGKIVSPVVEG
jgi:serpin B